MSEITTKNDDKEDTILSLYRLGWQPRRIALETDEDIKQVRTIIHTASKSTQFYNKEDKELADAMRDLAWRAYYEAREIFDIGSPAEKFQMTKILLSRTAAMVGQQTTTRYDEMRTELDTIIATALRGTDEILAEPEYDEAELTVGAAVIDVDDSDQGLDY